MGLFGIQWNIDNNMFKATIFLKNIFRLSLIFPNLALIFALHIYFVSPIFSNLSLVCIFIPYFSVLSPFLYFLHFLPYFPHYLSLMPDDNHRYRICPKLLVVLLIALLIFKCFLYCRKVAKCPDC